MSTPPPRVDRTGSNSSILVRSSESSVITKVVSASRNRTGSAGNREDVPPESSPRSVLANVRARFTRNRSASSGNEDESSPQSSSPFMQSKERKSPRSPRDETAAAPLPPDTRKAKSKTELRPTALQTRDAEKSESKVGVVRRREPGGEERRPGWVASMERNRDDPQLLQLQNEARAQIALKEKAASVGDKKDKSPLVDKKTLPSPPQPRPEKPSGPPKKKLPSPRTREEESDTDMPIMVEIDSSEFK